MSKSKVEYNAREHGEQLKSFIKECSDHKAIVESANTAIGEIRKRAADELGVPAAKFNKLFSIYHKDQREKFENEADEIIEDYDELFTS